MMNSSVLAQQVATKKAANQKSWWAHARYVLSDNPFTLVSALMFVVLVLVALFGRWLVPFDPLASNVGPALSPPSTTNWFGTDALGRDIFSRVVYGARISLSVGAATAILAVGIGLRARATLNKQQADKKKNRSHHDGIATV